MLEDLGVRERCRATLLDWAGPWGFRASTLLPLIKFLIYGMQLVGTPGDSHDAAQVNTRDVCFRRFAGHEAETMMLLAIVRKQVLLLGKASTRRTRTGNALKATRSLSFVRVQGSFFGKAVRANCLVACIDTRPEDCWMALLMQCILLVLVFLVQ